MIINSSFTAYDYKISVSHKFKDLDTPAPSLTTLNLNKPEDTVELDPWQELMKLVENGESDLLGNWNPSGEIATTISNPISSYTITNMNALDQSKLYTATAKIELDDIEYNDIFNFRVKINENDEITFDVEGDNDIFKEFSNVPLIISTVAEDEDKIEILISTVNDSNYYFNFGLNDFEQINNPLLLSHKHKFRINVTSDSAPIYF